MMLFRYSVPGECFTNLDQFNTGLAISLCQKKGGISIDCSQLNCRPVKCFSISMVCACVSFQERYIFLSFALLCGDSMLQI